VSCDNIFTPNVDSELTCTGNFFGESTFGLCCFSFLLKESYALLTTAYTQRHLNYRSENIVWRLLLKKEPHNSGFYYNYQVLMETWLCPCYTVFMLDTLTLIFMINTIFKLWVWNLPIKLQLKILKSTRHLKLLLTSNLRCNLRWIVASPWSSGLVKTQRKLHLTYIDSYYFES
jgi:hypothetical protein